MGGIVKWLHLKKQVELHLQNEPGAYVTTLIDYYGLYTKYNFPSWDRAHMETNPNTRMDILEEGMLSSIDENIRHRFIPYIQLHEFEGLIFNDIEIFYSQIPENEIIGKDELQSTFDLFQNPELINNGITTAPSKRLSRIISGYNKVIYGSILIEEIGIDRIRSRCPRFNNWIQYLEKIAS